MEDDNSNRVSLPFRGFPATSEVGSESNSEKEKNKISDEEKCQKILEQQQKNFMEIINSVKPNNTKIDLPEFVPEKENNVRAWIVTSEMCMSGRPLRGESLINALTRAMKSEASSWFTQIVHPELNWDEFKTIFSLRYENQETLASFLINLNKGKPREVECIAAYATTVVNSIINRWKNCSIEEIAVKNSEGQPERNLTDPKRFKEATSSHNIKCFYCGKLGHKSVECRSKKRDYKNSSKPNTW